MEIIKLSLISILMALALIGCWEDPYSEPPLHDAAMRGNVKKINELLKKGVEVDSKNDTGSTALHWAAFKGHLDVAKVLIRHGADVNALSDRGSTPLRLATTHEKSEMIILLKNHGAY